MATMQRHVLILRNGGGSRASLLSLSLYARGCILHGYRFVGDSFSEFPPPSILCVSPFFRRFRDKDKRKRVKYEYK